MELRRFVPLAPLPGAVLVVAMYGIDSAAESTGYPAHPWPMYGSIAGWCLLLIGLMFTVPTALSGLADWLTITWGSPLWWTATWHMLSMLTATVFFLIAALAGHGGYRHGAVDAGPFILTVVGFGFLTLGGWLGGAVVYVHGMRVLSLTSEPPGRAVSPLPHPEKERAEGA